MDQYKCPYDDSYIFLLSAEETSLIIDSLEDSIMSNLLCEENCLEDEDNLRKEYKKKTRKLKNLQRDLIEHTGIVSHIAEDRS